MQALPVEHFLASLMADLRYKSQDLTQAQQHYEACVLCDDKLGAADAEQEVARLLGDIAAINWRLAAAQKEQDEVAEHDTRKTKSRKSEKNVATQLSNGLC